MSAIDIGSRWGILAEFRESTNANTAAGIDILQDKAGQSPTDVVVGYPYGDKEVMTGKSARNMTKRDPHRAFFNLIRLIDIQSHEKDKIEYEQQFIEAEIKYDQTEEGGELYFNIDGEDVSVTEILSKFIRIVSQSFNEKLKN